MKNAIIIVLLVILCGLTAYQTYALQHNLFYGNCAYDNNTVPIYTQLIHMDNPSHVAKPVRRWYDFILRNPFRRHETTAAPKVPPKSVNTTIIFPPPVSFSHILFISQNYFNRSKQIIGTINVSFFCVTRIKIIITNWQKKEKYFRSA